MTATVIDSPRAWFTVVGAFIANFILGGLAKSYGIIMENYQREFEGAPTAYFTLTGGILYMLMFTLSLPNHFVVQRIGHRTVVMVGGITACISLIAAAAAPNVVVWVIAVGGGLGFSFSCVYFNIFSAVGQCFRKRLGIANGLSVAGVSVGQMAFPSLVTHLLEVYGVRAGTFIMAAFLLHICVTAALMPRRVVESGEELLASISSSKDVSSSIPMSSTDDMQVDALGDNLERQKLKPFDDDVDIEATKSNDLLPDILIVSTDRQEKLATALLVIYVIGKVFADNGDVGISLIAPPYGFERGFTSATINIAIAVSGGVDLVSRLGFGWLTDHACCMGKRSYFLAAVWMVEGINGLALGQIYGFSWNSAASNAGVALLKGAPTPSQTVAFYICFAIHGVCSGTAMTQMVIVLSDFVGPHRLDRSLAIMMAVLGVTYVPAQALTGHLNDVFKTYSWSMRLCGFWLMIASLVFLLEYPLRHFFRSAVQGRHAKRRALPAHDGFSCPGAFGDGNSGGGKLNRKTLGSSEMEFSLTRGEPWATDLSSSVTSSPKITMDS